MEEIMKLYQDLHDSLGTDEICAEFSERILRIIQSALDEIPSGSKVGIRCADPCAEYLIETIDFSGINVVGVFDMVRTGTFCGYPILPARILPEAACDYIIFATYLFREDILRELDTFNGKVIDVYALLEKQGIKLRAPLNFYQFGLPMVLNYFYLNYWEAQDERQKESTLHDLLQAALEYKDFSTIMKLYHDNGGANGSYPVLIETWDKSRILLEKIQAKIAARKQKDILAFWTDEISHSDLEYMPGLTARTNHGTFFSRTYTPAPWTHPVLKSIFEKLLPIDGFPKTQDIIRRETSTLIQYLEENDYEFRWISFPIWAMDPQYNIPQIKRYMSTSMIWWQGLQSLLKSPKPCFYIFHFIAESHEPMFAPDLVNVNYFRPVTCTKSRRAMEQRKASLAYLDQCLMLYDQICETKIRIFFSDHGYYWVDTASWAEERLHVYCLVLGNSIPTKKVEKYFSYIKFEELVRWLIEPEKYELDDALTDEAFSQDVDYYHETMVHAAKNLIKKGYPKNGIAFRCIRAQNYKYVLNALGEEHYYIIGEDGTETLMPLQDNALRAELQGKCGTYFIDIRKYDKFKYTRKLYESVLQDHPELGKPLWFTKET